ncbi:TPA: AAA family ATPase [Proteus mirabilis]|uniref:ATP-dependent nuclease n=1 Tax=Proteus mirabilis TaxID=584 RepID=UPI0015E847CB|nr:AAA family ATPase [Proteus mirabilis]ELA9907289.1 AAA family ATPase [Proteus mirabilis]MDC9762737.1 AAA family ATPase [Proteus mirabilis]MDM3742744.1 AAA family ATPase [Proteus mirabilis]HBC7477179.1 AAA family ATPase [Proteus mirabilis]HCR4048249.1 AAA family ATPase [Proteus mirabilis]
MYLTELTITNFRSFGSDGITVKFREGLTALVGENDSGKTAVIDALRFLLGTTDQEWLRFSDDDFHKTREDSSESSEIKISGTFKNLTSSDKLGFVEYLTYGINKDDEPTLHLTLTAKRMGTRAGRPYISTEIRSGKNGEGPNMDNNCRSLLAATYLRPLRDAERELSSGRNSRLSMVLNSLDGAEMGQLFDAETFSYDDIKKLGLLGLGDLFNKLIEHHPHIENGKSKVNNHLEKLQLHGDSLKSSISVSQNGSDSQRLRQLLEKLTLNVDNTPGRMGLGSNNILFIACELILLADDQEHFPLLLIEEPEAHVHAQRQLRLIQYLQKIVNSKKDEENKPQIIITTHSPNLASEVNLNNLVIIQAGRAFSTADGETELDSNDYKFLSRFLDVTKANLFFARGVMIVEGDAENILIPTLAKCIGKDFTEHGVSMINVGGVGLRRYAKIFMRKNPDQDGIQSVPVACVTDLDVMPNCAPYITKVIQDDSDWTILGDGENRKWRAKRDFTLTKLNEHKEKIKSKAHGQNVKSFVADEWTLEYDLAFANNNALAEELYIAAQLAIWDEGNNYSEKTAKEKFEKAQSKYTTLKEEADKLAADKGWNKNEVLASKVYAMYVTGSKASKSIAAQYLCGIIMDKITLEKTYDLRTKLPSYIVDAIDYVTSNLHIASGGEINEN